MKAGLAPTRAQSSREVADVLYRKGLVICPGSSSWAGWLYSASSVLPLDSQWMLANVVLRRHPKKS